MRKYNCVTYGDSPIPGKHFIKTLFKKTITGGERLVNEFSLSVTHGPELTP